jgi:hypothetical protein
MTNDSGSRGRGAGREQLGAVLRPAVLDALEVYIDERISDALAAKPQTNGSGHWLPLQAAAELDHCSADALRMRIQRRPDRYQTRREGSRIYVARSSIDPESA